MGDYWPEVGDKVRVVMEGEVHYTYPEAFTFGDEKGDRTFVTRSSARVVSVKKLEPDAAHPVGLTLSEDGNLLNWLGENYVRQPVVESVVTFKPGQLLRGLESSLYYTLMPDGYLVWGSDGQGFWQPGDLERRFTSRDFELVELK